MNCEIQIVSGGAQKVECNAKNVACGVPLPGDRLLPTAFRRLPAADCLLLSVFFVLLLTSSCKVGPNYQRPAAPVPAAYKETPPPAGPTDANTWKPAQPSDSASRGKWWEIYHDPQLNALEEQVTISNQNVIAAEAQFREARYAVRAARSALFPTVTTSPSISRSRSSNTLTNSQFTGSSTSSVTIYDLPFDISWQADIWGSIRRSVTSSADTAQASFAQLENARLSFQAELAQDYFGLRGTDGEEGLLQATVKSYEEYLQLTKDRFASGVASGADVAQAQTQLDTARAQLIDYGVARAQFEHSIAVLTGKPPAALSVPYAPN
ncbi:MAG TPA: TolC family protein, partial [Terriglobia bacterium]